MSSYLLTYPSVSESEERMLDDLDRIVVENDIPSETGRKLVLAISEAFTNALIHGNRLESTKLIKIALQVNDRFISADVTDQGRGGLERIQARKEPELLAENGRGINLIEHYAEASFAEDENGGLVVSIKLEQRADKELKH